jgi:hypothetical protein
MSAENYYFSLQELVPHLRYVPCTSIPLEMGMTDYLDGRGYHMREHFPENDHITKPT